MRNRLKKLKNAIFLMNPNDSLENIISLQQHYIKNYCL